MISIVIPALNEEKRIGPTLQDYASVFNQDAEIIVVDNGSLDDTVALVKKTQQNHPRIRLLKFNAPLGKGGAVYTGFRKARGEILGFADADGATKAKEFSKLISEVKDKKVDAAIASRYTQDASVLTPQPLKRRLFSRVFNLFVQLLFGLKLKDTQLGAKVLTRQAYQAVADQLGIKNYAFDVELLWRLKQNGYNIKEIGICWEDQAGSRLNPLKDGLKSVIALVSLRLKL